MSQFELIQAGDELPPTSPAAPALPFSASMAPWHRPGLAALVVFYLALAMAFSQVMAFNKGPDEGINLDYIEFIATKGRLPVTYEERAQVGPKANWPALYHLIVAGISRFFNVYIEGPPRIKVFWDSFRYRAMDIGSQEAWFLTTEDFEWPYYGRILVLHLGRWLSILFSTATLLLVYRIILEVLPDWPGLGVVTAAILAFIPTFIFVGTSLNEDALVAVLAALYFWLLIRVIKQPAISWPYWLMGLSLGLSITVKYTTVILPLEFIVVLAVVARQQGYTWGWWVRRITIVGSSAVLASSWWFGWNFWFLNEIETLGPVAGLLRPIFTGGTDVTLARLGNFLSGGQIGLAALPENTDVGTFSEWLRFTFLSFWGVSIGDAGIPLFPYVYLVIALLIALATIGLWRLWQLEPSSHRWLTLMGVHISFFIILPLVRFGLSRRLGQTAQGRHILIPAAAAVAGLLVWGLATAIPRPWQRLIFPVIIIGFAGWTGVHLYRLGASPAPPLPLRTLPQAAEWLPDVANVRFGDKIQLASYEIDPQPEQGLLQLNLAWRSLAPINENYLLKVSLLNSQGQIVSHWLGYNGQGRLPSLAWEPGDVIFDRLTLPLPDLPPGAYLAQIQVLSHTGPLAVNGDTQPERREESLATTLSLADIYLDRPSVLSLPHRLSLTGPNDSLQVAFALWQTNGPAEINRSPASAGRYPSYRYPATVSIIISNDRLNNAALSLELVDEADRAWAATQDAAGIYTFIIGPRWPSGDYRLRLTLKADDKVIGRTISQPLLTVENWWKRRFEVPEIATAVEANFANQIKFLGYTLSESRVQAGEAFPLTLYWQALPNMSPQADFIQFNHLLDSTGRLHGGYDRRPLEYYSTLLWAPGEVVVDGYAVPVDADAPPGEYYLDVGYYLTVGESAINLPLVVDGQVTASSSVTVGPIEVTAP